MRGDLVKRCLTGTYSALADGSTGNVAVNVPISVNDGLAIQVWGLDYEYTAEFAHAAATKGIEVVLAATAGTGRRYLNDRDVLLKHSVWNMYGSNVGNTVFPRAYSLDIYPAIPYFGSQIHVTLYNDSGAAQTSYFKIWYSFIQMNQREMLTQLQNQIV
jgi:hypothetical protein